MRLEDLRGKRIELFLDDGGVLNDNRLRRPEWLRLIGEFMPPRLGGTAEQWATANLAAIPGVLQRVQQRLPEFGSHQEQYRTYATDWFAASYAHLGLEPLPEDQAVALYKELSCYVAERASTAIPGAAGAVLALRRAGHTLRMGSGTPSWELRGILGRMGIANAFLTLYGPDLIDHVKYGPAFYEKLFAHAGVEPSRALVIESDEQCCRWAAEAGASTVWIDLEGRGDATMLAGLVSAITEGDA